MGKILLAGLSKQDQREWMDRTELTPSGPNSILRKTLFRTELERVRNRGLAINDRELVGHMVAVAAPIRNGETVSAAIGIAANANVISATSLATKCHDDLLISANELAEHLGYEPPPRRSTK